jgi:hypothetical protein
MGTNQEKRKLGLGLVESVVGKELRERFEWLGEKKRVENGQYTRFRCFIYLYLRV